MYLLSPTRKYVDDAKKFPDDTKAKLKEQHYLLEENPFHPGLETHKLKGALSAYWAFYVTGGYRVIFRFLEDNEVIYYDIGTHDIYK